MKRLAVFLVALISVVPVSPQGHIFIRRAAAGNCGASTDFGDISAFVTWNNAACSSRTTSYTTDTTDTDETDGDYPDGFVLTHTDPGSNDDADLWNNNPVEPFTTCALDVDTTPLFTDNGGGFEFVDFSNNGGTWPTSQVTILLMFNHNDGTDEPPTTANFILDIGVSGTDNVIQYRIDDSGRDLEVFVRDGSDTTLSQITTDGDTTSGCCGGSHCDSLFDSGDTNDGVDTSIMFQFDSTQTAGNDFIRLYIDGCQVAEALGTYTAFDFITTDDIRLGQWPSTENGDFRLGAFAMANAIVDLHNLISGGDDDMTDGDECHCDDYGASGVACGTDI